MAGVAIGTLLTVFSAVGPVRAANDDKTVVAIPPSPVLANFCGDVADFYPDRLTVVVYPSRGNPGNLGLHLWDLARWRWRPLAWARWTAGDFQRNGDKKVLLIELSPGDSAPLAEAASDWAAEVEVVEGYGLHEVANALNAHLGFSPSQWQYLARRHDLVLVDRNYERRKYGRFGKPGGGETRNPEPRPAPGEILVREPAVEASRTGEIDVPENDETAGPESEEAPTPKSTPPPERPAGKVEVEALDVGDGEPTEAAKEIPVSEKGSSPPASLPDVEEAGTEDAPPPAPPSGLEEALRPEQDDFWQMPSDTK